MRRFRKKINHWTAKILDVPPDITMDLPRLTMIGNLQLFIENHRGVLHFSDQYLKLALSKGILEVHGKNLSIRTIMSEEVLVEGTIMDLKYIP
jgi:sporulation protein YqfC